MASRDEMERQYFEQFAGDEKPHLIRLITRRRDAKGYIIGEDVSFVEDLRFGHRYLTQKDGTVVDIDS